MQVLGFVELMVLEYRRNEKKEEERENKLEFVHRMELVLNAQGFEKHMKMRKKKEE